MANFTNLLRKAVKGSAETVFASGNPGSYFLRVINDLRERILDNSGVVDSFIGAFTLDSSLIADKFADDGTEVEVSLNGGLATISEELALQVYESLKQAIHQEDNYQGSDEGQLTVTTSDGDVVGFYDVDQGEDMFHNRPLISCKSGNRTISFMVLGKINKRWVINNFVRTVEFAEGVRGKVVSLWKIVSDQIESAAINDAIVNAIDALRSTSADAAAMALAMQEAFNSKFNSVRFFAKSVATALHRGGVLGAASYIIQYVQAASGITDNQGVLEFTTNANLVPKQYIAGLITQVASGVAQVAGVIAMAFSRILGVLLTVAGGVLGQVFKAVNYDYSLTVSAMNPSDKALLPASPIGCFKGEFLSSSVSNTDLANLIQAGETLFYLSVPGGFIFVGPGEIGSDNVVNKWRCEFHPSVTNGKAFVDVLLDNFLSDGYLSLTHVGGEAPNYIFALSFTEGSLRSQTIAEWWNNHASSAVYANGNNDRLSVQDDLEIERCIMTNIMIFLLYSGELLGESFMNTHNMGYVMIDSSNHICPRYSLVPADTYETGIFFPLIFENSIVRHFYPSVNGNVIDVTLQPWSAMSYEYPSWAQAINLVDKCVGLYADYGSLGLWYLNNVKYFDSISRLPADNQYCVFLPEYDRGTFWFYVVTTAAVSVLVTAATVFAVYSIRKGIQKRRALNQAQVESDWQNLTKNPTEANYEKYRRTVKKNNRWATLIGGTKYDLVNYWNGDKRDSGTGEIDGSILNGFSSSDLVNGLSSQNSNISAENNTNSKVSEFEIYKAIVGHSIS